MDPFAADIIARGRRHDLAGEAEESRTARAACDHVEESRPVPRPKRPAASPRRVAWLG